MVDLELEEPCALCYVLGRWRKELCQKVHLHLKQADRRKFIDQFIPRALLSGSCGSVSIYHGYTYIYIGIYIFPSSINSDSATTVRVL